jgi:hypothetical protein
MVYCQIGRPRRKEETTAQLKSMFEEASTLDSKTKVQSMRTESGIKDTHQMFFLEKLFKSYKGKRGRESKQAALDTELGSLPDIITSPVWRIKGAVHIALSLSILTQTLASGLDPHRDTPVEILHVVLLGFVKYLWRDLVQNQLGNNDAKKSLLATRLTSFDVSGLGISPLAGQTLVQYSGSLTGRDFRALAQAAPFVAYDLVSKDCLDTWVALSKLIPLIWQPEIADIDAHCVSLCPCVNINFYLPSYPLRHFWTTKSNIFSSVLLAGLFAGLTNPNFTFSCISQNTFAVLALLYYSLRRLSNRSML